MEELPKVERILSSCYVTAEDASTILSSFLASQRTNDDADLFTITASEVEGKADELENVSFAPHRKWHDDPFAVLDEELGASLGTIGEVTARLCAVADSLSGRQFTTRRTAIAAATSAVDGNKIIGASIKKELPLSPPTESALHHDTTNPPLDSYKQNGLSDNRTNNGAFRGRTQPFRTVKEADEAAGGHSRADEGSVEALPAKVKTEMENEASQLTPKQLQRLEKKEQRSIRKALKKERKETKRKRRSLRASLGGGDEKNDFEKRPNKKARLIKQEDGVEP